MNRPVATIAIAIVAGHRAPAAETALRLCRCFENIVAVLDQYTGARFGRENGQQVI